MQLADSLNFISKLNFRKVLNASSVLSSYCISKWSKLPVQWGLPFNISIEPTTNCNLGCPECPSGLKSFTRPTGNLDNNFYRKMIDEMSDELIYLYLYFQGEPYMNGDFLEMVKYASQKKIYTVTSTNGHFLTERKARETVAAGLDRIIISIDGTTQEVYEQYRKGGTLQKVLEGTKNLVKAKREMKSATPHIIFQFLVVKPNEHQLQDVKTLAKEIGVDELKFKTAQVYNYKHGNELIPEQEEYSRYKKLADGTYTVKNELADHCWKLWHSCVVTWDGKIVPCCFDKDAKHQLGDLNKQPLAEIWRNEPYRTFRRKVLQSRKEIDICTNCSEGTKVWA